MKPTGIDHLVPTVASIDATVDFYCEILGFEEVCFGAGRKAVRCGNQKINLHQAGSELVPHAAAPTAGSADICLIYSGSLDEIEAAMRKAGVEIEVGPVGRTGACGAIRSIYVRDPDSNLVELSVYSE